jgi:hypothetical protein
MNTAPKSEKKYSAPKLVRYGEMVKLTATGSGTQAENAGQQVPTRHP